MLHSITFRYYPYILSFNSKITKLKFHVNKFCATLYIFFIFLLHKNQIIFSVLKQCQFRFNDYVFSHTELVCYIILKVINIWKNVSKISNIVFQSFYSNDNFKNVCLIASTINENILK